MCVYDFINFKFPCISRMSYFCKKCVKSKTQSAFSVTFISMMEREKKNQVFLL